MKALGNQLGRFVLVFNCDETFDFQAMGRIFVGLCQVGAWGCFDEFNRLEERMLSAVSQQIQTIQESLKNRAVSKDGVCLLVWFRVFVLRLKLVCLFVLFCKVLRSQSALNWWGRMYG